MKVINKHIKIDKNSKNRKEFHYLPYETRELVHKQIKNNNQDKI